MLTGKYWIFPGGGVIDTSRTEHAVLAREKILRLDRDDPIRKKSPFYKLTENDVKRLLRREPIAEYRQYNEAVKYMACGGDARWWAIEKYDWIRVAKGGMWVWRFDATVLKHLRNAVEYWDAQKSQVSGEMVNLIETSTKGLYEIPVEKLRAAKETVETLQRYKSVASDFVV